MDTEAFEEKIAKIKRLIPLATPGPYFYNGYSAIYSEPLSKEYARIEATIATPWDPTDPAWETLPDPAVAYVPVQAGDTATKQGAIDAQYLELVSPDFVKALLDRIEELESKHACPQGT